MDHSGRGNHRRHIERMSQPETHLAQAVSVVQAVGEKVEDVIYVSLKINLLYLTVSKIKIQKFSIRGFSPTLS